MKRPQFNLFNHHLDREPISTIRNDWIMVVTPWHSVNLASGAFMFVFTFGYYMNRFEWDYETENDRIRQAFRLLISVLKKERNNTRQLVNGT